jgi:hypothetical protein
MAAKSIFLLYILALAIAVPAPLSAATGTDEAASNFDVSLMVDGKLEAETWINLSGGGTLIEIPAAPVLSALKAMIGDDLIRKLEGQTSPEGTFTNKVLARAGIFLSINVPLQQVYLSVSKAAAKTKSAPAAETTAPAAKAAPPTEAVQVVAPDSAPRAAKPKSDSGPWTSPAVPPLPGERADSASGKSHPAKPVPEKAVSIPAPIQQIDADKNWEVVKTDSSVRKPTRPGAPVIGAA